MAEAQKKLDEAVEAREKSKRLRASVYETLKFNGFDCLGFEGEEAALLLLGAIALGKKELKPLVKKDPEDGKEKEEKVR